MSIRILGGVAKGMSVVTPKSSSVRPTSVTLKRKLFDAIQDFSDSDFIDLCCGSGSVGLEALSRKAHHVTFVDKNFHSIQAVKENLKLIQKYGIDSTAHTTVVKADSLKWLQGLSSLKIERPLTLFFDPPYELTNLYEDVYTQVISSGVSMTFVMEACAQKTMPLAEFLQKFPDHSKIYQKGTSYFVIYDLK